MTKIEIGTTASRILAIYCWSESIRSSALVFSIITMVISSPAHWQSWAETLNAIPVICLVVGGLILWRNAVEIGRRIAATGESEPPGGSPASSDDWQTMAFATVGLWLLVQGIPDTISLAGYLIPVRSPSPLMVGDGHPVYRLIACIVQSIIGYQLLIGARGITSWLNRRSSNSIDGN